MRETNVQAIRDRLKSEFNHVLADVPWSVQVDEYRASPCLDHLASVYGDKSLTFTGSRVSIGLAVKAHPKVPRAVHTQHGLVAKVGLSLDPAQYADQQQLMSKALELIDNLLREHRIYPEAVHA